LGYGELDVSLTNEKGRKRLRLFDVAYCPQFPTNLASLLLLEVRGIDWTHRTGKITVGDDPVALGNTRKIHGQYVVEDHQTARPQDKNHIAKVLPDEIVKLVYSRHGGLPGTDEEFLSAVQEAGLIYENMLSNPGLGSVGKDAPGSTSERSKPVPPPAEEPRPSNWVTSLRSFQTPTRIFRRPPRHTPWISWA